MTTYYKVLALVGSMVFTLFAQAQNSIKGKIIDALTHEPIAGASINCCNSKHGCASNTTGYFQLECKESFGKVQVTFIGYQPLLMDAATGQELLISLMPVQSLLQEVVISANREGVKRSQAPIAISSISTKVLQEAKPVSIDQVLNKVSGVNMVNLGNEQHQMSIRQPMTTKSLFLYLEDGIPVRTTGLFNHNALLEMNMAAVKNIEVIKGPSSALYGSEAIGGVVNFITAAPTVDPLLKLSVQGSTLSYQRGDVQSSFTTGKWGFTLNGYYAQKKEGFIEYSSFNKKTVSAKIEYRFSHKTQLSNSITWMNYYSDMPGGIDSTMFANRVFTNPQTFTYRKVQALRYRTSLTQTWNSNSKTTASIIYRDNTIAQNPEYSIKNDYRKVGSNWTGDKTLAHGEINSSSFNSYAAIIQHRQSWRWKDAVLIGGLNLDYSPSAYQAAYIRIEKDTITKKYKSYEAKDSLLTSYKTRIRNYAGFINFECTPFQKLRFITSLRYDVFHYGYDNFLKPSAFSGAPDTSNRFSAISPKVGFTYNLSNRTGFYANYSQGFVPPQVTEMYRGVKVPELKPSVFYNYEVGGWAEIIKNKLSADFSAYQLKGTNEVIAVKLDDGTTQNQNAGKTAHKGIELSISSTPVKEVTIRFGGAYSHHQFTRFVEKGTSYSGNNMNGAPVWMHNAEVGYKPSFIKGLRLNAEWQRVGRYYMDPKNTIQYKGYHVLHLRAGYSYRNAEIWVNVMNATNNYYAVLASKSSFGYSYTPAEPRQAVIGFAYNFGGLLKKK